MTLSAGTYLSEKFLEHDDDEEACTNLNLKLQEYIRAMSNLCSKHEAAQLMCKSLTNMFKGLHVDKLDKCVLDCKIPEEEVEEESKLDFFIRRYRSGTSVPNIVCGRTLEMSTVYPNGITNTQSEINYLADERLPAVMGHRGWAIGPGSGWSPEGAVSGYMMAFEDLGRS
ncbi:hypothetical protein ANCCEY_13011 [Ancylostoma ceylanicum]|uniref:Uncharacterized protein n=1 Tax=Ancylostoma ceylanicum TaxID=53326 RepID=A0A0D6LJU7_9BILA|nr:hypothetical protein ANCCEY_13011 [Ancylostoma ceylanicum]